MLLFKLSFNSSFIYVFWDIFDMKYTIGEFKADAVTGILNGMTFGVIYSFFTHPFELEKAENKLKYKGRTSLYYRSWIWRMGLAFGILRTSYNAISK